MNRNYNIIKYKYKPIRDIFIINKNYTWIKSEDINHIRIWRNQQIQILRQDRLINLNEQKKYFKNFYYTNCLSKRPLSIIFAIKENENLIGYGGFVNISWKHKRSEISFLVKTSIANNKKLYKKHFKDFFKFIFKVSFEVLKFNKIYTETFISRKSHIKLLKKEGFKEEGLLKYQYIKNKKKINSILHARFK